MAFAAAEFRLSRRQADGKTLREHLQVAAEHSVAAQLELALPPLPDAVVPVWQWFLELSLRRGSSGFGPDPIGWQDLDAWQRVSGVAARWHEREWLFELDRLFLADVAEEAQARAEKPKRRR